MSSSSAGWTVFRSLRRGKQLTAWWGDHSPAWVPGGAYIVFGHSWSVCGVGGIYVVPHAGGTTIRVVGISNDYDVVMAWSR